MFDSIHLCAWLVSVPPGILEGGILFRSNRPGHSLDNISPARTTVLLLLHSWNRFVLHSQYLYQLMGGGGGGGGISIGNSEVVC